ncbi:uncharacterized protein LOC131422909 [Diceros bicornis minor]|uniref:uncharacterized protein LOC131422909 n=1 Tax=Diceros bicornis minor TaxID=77932 RepID=UPI0026ED9268|nr:uncharacterized protein LOC131422909 [Diceros bicornis minor]
MGGWQGGGRSGPRAGPSLHVGGASCGSLRRAPPGRRRPVCAGARPSSAGRPGGVGRPRARSRVGLAVGPGGAGCGQRGRPEAAERGAGYLEEKWGSLRSLHLRDRRGGRKAATRTERQTGRAADEGGLVEGSAPPSRVDPPAHLARRCPVELPAGMEVARTCAVLRLRALQLWPARLCPQPPALRLWKCGPRLLCVLRQIWAPGEGSSESDFAP